MALLSSTTTKITTAWNATELTQVLVGGTANVGVGDLIFTGDLPFGSAHLVLTSGTAPGGIQLNVANDGLLSAGTPQPLTNPVALGPSLTTYPNMIDLATGSIIATGPGIAPTGGFAQTPYKYLQFNITAAAGGAFTVTITMVFMGTRG